MPINHNKIIGVIAPKGSGKTYQVCKHLYSVDRFAAFVIFRSDTGYLAVADNVVFESPRQLAEAMKPERFRLVYHPSIPQLDLSGDFNFPSFNTFIEICYRRGNCTAVIDEAHLICDAKNAPPWLLMTLIDGRRRGVDILYVSHRFSTVHRMLTANTDEFWFYKITEPADLQGIRQRCGVDVMERVANLDRLELVNGTVKPGQRIRWTTYQGIIEEPRPTDQGTGVPLPETNEKTKIVPLANEGQNNG